MSAATASGNSRWRKVAVGSVVLAGLGLLLWQTNPSHLKHHAKIWPGPAPTELMDLSRLNQPDLDFIRARVPERAKTTWQNFGFFSMSSNKRNGSRSSFGILGFVLDLRTVDQAQSEQAIEMVEDAGQTTEDLIKNLNRNSEMIHGVRGANESESSRQAQKKLEGQQP